MSTIEFILCWNSKKHCQGNWLFEKMAVRIKCDDGTVYRAAIRVLGLLIGTTWVSRK